VNCAEVREALPAYVRNGEMPLAVRHHLSGCPECRAELARYEVLLDGLDALRTQMVDVPPTLIRSLWAIPSRRRHLRGVERHVARHRHAYLGGLAVAAAGAAGAAVWRSRARRPAAA
jgi:predicted anti-sigma-YlaC factor YlaD